jgi:hypothetical protein
MRSTSNVQLPATVIMAADIMYTCLFFSRCSVTCLSAVKVRDSESAFVCVCVCVCVCVYSCRNKSDDKSRKKNLLSRVRLFVERQIRAADLCVWNSYATPKFSEWTFKYFCRRYYSDIWIVYLARGWSKYEFSNNIWVQYYITKFLHTEFTHFQPFSSIFRRIWYK